MTDKTEDFPRGEQVRWYNSAASLELAKGMKSGLGQGIMYALLCIGGGIGFAKAMEAGAKFGVPQIEAQNRVEYQRLRTLEEITRSFGSRMSPQEFKDFLKEYQLQPKK